MDALTDRAGRIPQFSRLGLRLLVGRINPDSHHPGARHALRKGDARISVFPGRPPAKIPNPGIGGLVAARTSGPWCPPAPKKRDEIPPLHVPPVRDHACTITKR